MSRRRRFMWIMLTPFALAILALAAGWTWQRIAERRDDRLYPPPGHLYAVSGRLTHIYCQGTGSPTIIIEQGIGGPSIDWNDINRRMAGDTRVCDYDRAGMGYSEPAWRPTRSTDVARNLHGLLAAARMDDDIVFVAWSAGGLYAREYFRQFPDRVKGMVLVDSAHEQTVTRMPPQPGNQDNLDHLMRQYHLAQFGWLRLKGEIAHQYADAPLPEDDRRRLVAFFLKTHTWHTLADEGIGLEQDLARGAPPPSLGDMPLVVIAEGNPRHPYMKENLAKWHELQGELAALSTRGRLVIAQNSAHFIHRTEPGLIVNAARDVVREVRASAAAR
jgi:pimeloyl-ACP methyl ester carboxylesterase